MHMISYQAENTQNYQSKTVQEVQMKVFDQQFPHYFDQRKPIKGISPSLILRYYIFFCHKKVDYS